MYNPAKQTDIIVTINSTIHPVEVLTYLQLVYIVIKPDPEVWGKHGLLSAY